MKILYLTGGAGQMYCGSCLRDNALATELISRGHDVTLLPIYTPTRTDEPNVSNEKVFFGGVSVYLEQYVPFLRNPPRWISKLLDSKPMLSLASRGSATSPKMLGEMTVSMLKGEDGYQRNEIDKLVEWTKHEPPPDVISIPYTLLIGLAKPLKEALGRPICCTLQGEDLFLEGLGEPYKSEALGLIRANVKHVDRFISVSEYYAEFMPGYLNIPPDKIEIVPLGINLEGFGPRLEKKQSGFTIGFFARVAPEKGLHVLAEAYRRMRAEKRIPPCNLEVAGYLAREHRPYLEKIERQMHEAGLAGEFHYRGVLDRDQKIEFLSGLDVLSVPATYDEPKGIFLLEAMACGVPVVQPRRGGFTEIVKKTGGGLLVEPDDVDSLSDGIFRLYEDGELKSQLGRQGFEKVRELYSVQKMADGALQVYQWLTHESQNHEAAGTIRDNDWTPSAKPATTNVDAAPF